MSVYLSELRAVVGDGLLLLPGVAALIHDDDGRLLMIHRTDNGQWDIPAGAIEPGESPAAAVVREVREETGFGVHVVGIAGVLGPQSAIYPNGHRAEYTTIVFECSVASGPHDGVDGEADRVDWFDAGTLPAVPWGFTLERLFPRPGDPTWFDG